MKTAKMPTAKMPVRKWSSGRGALVIIALMFGVSAIIRLGAGTGQVIAQEVATLLPMPAGDEVTGIIPAAATADVPVKIAKLLADLSGRQQALDARERKLQELQQSLAVTEELIRKNLMALEAAETRLAATIETSETAAESDLARLTSVYENMNPKQASVLFEEMAPEFAAGFIGRMRADAAAEIMAGLSPQAAYTVSIILAGRNARAPTE